MVLSQVELEEIRSVCNCPKKFQLLDFMGVSFGAFFLTDGLKRLVKQKKITPAPTIEVVFGSIMVYIHSRRFVYAKSLGIQPYWDH